MKLKGKLKKVAALSKRKILKLEWKCTYKHMQTCTYVCKYVCMLLKKPICRIARRLKGKIFNKYDLLTTEIPLLSVLNIKIYQKLLNNLWFLFYFDLFTEQTEHR